MKNNDWIKMDYETVPKETQVLVYCPEAIDGFEYSIVKITDDHVIKQWHPKKDDYTHVSDAESWNLTHYKLIEKPSI